MSKAYLIALILFVSGCSNRLIPLNDQFTTNEFGIYLHFDIAVDEDIRMAIERAASDFIVEYNFEDNPFTLNLEEDDCQECFALHITNTKFVESSQQGAAVLINIVGLIALPVVLGSVDSPLILFFWYFPKTVSEVELTLPETISGTLENNPIMLYPNNSGFLRSRRKQVIKHSQSFAQFLGHIIKKVEKQYKKNSFQSP